MMKIKDMKYFSLIRNVFKFEIFYKVIVLFCLGPMIRWILQRYLRSISFGIVFNQDMLFEFLSWHGILIVLLLFLFMTLMTYYELYVLMNIFALEHENEKYSLRKVMLKSFVQLRLLHYPSFCISGAYLVFLLPFIHVGFMSSYILRWNVPYFIVHHFQSTQLLNLFMIFIYFFLYSLFIIMIFIPVYICLKKKNIIQAIKESFYLWKRISLKEKGVLICFVLGWTLLDRIIINFFVYPILKNNDFGFYFLKYVVTSTAFRYSVYQYIFIWLLSMIGMVFFIHYIVDLAYRYEEDLITVKEVPIDTNQMNQKIHQFEQMIYNFLIQIKEAIFNSRFYQKNKTMSQIVMIGIVLCLLSVYFDQEAYIHQPWVIGHRGSAYEIENTLSAVKNANELKADYTEIDIQLSKDLVPVVFHDNTLSRLSSSDESVSDLTLSSLQEIILSQSGKNDEHIVTLEDLLIEMKKENMTTRLLIELKPTDDYEILIEKMIEVVNKYQMGHKAIFMSNDFRVVSELRRRESNWWIGYCIYGSVGNIDDSIWDMNIDFLAIEESVASTTFIQKAVDHMIPIYIWTVNDEKRMKQYLDMGVSGLITDYPDKARELVDDYLQRNERNYYYQIRIEN